MVSVKALVKRSGRCGDEAPSQGRASERLLPRPQLTKSSLSPPTYALSVNTSVQCFRESRLCLTDVRLINILDPISKKHIGHDQYIELRNEFSLLFCVLGIEPTDLIPPSSGSDLSHLEGRLDVITLIEMVSQASWGWWLI